MADRMAEIRARLEAATPGPLQMDTHEHPEAGCRCLSCHITTGWRLDHPTWVCCDEVPEMRAAALRAQAAARRQEDCPLAPIPYADAVFLAAAHEDVTYLLAEIERLEVPRE